ncbi:hypothetical protein MINTM005_13860 [Mycobacterium intracellulare]|uniref:hypothetical protein n=1 Tax=Mycobacterium intracellulare TaxID=1767 RepID=UPI0019294753|nr:hypothetical protein [Mycobacterium intracellulare]BCO56142.1 hypothetical protein MINTM005_13860 [Mycobacterium intracellulare]
MFDWLRRLLPREQPIHLDPETLDSGDWIVMPYRLAEAARISMYTIASHPEVPDNLRWWIVQWLNSYNTALATWFFQNYGPSVFPALAEITNGVRQLSEQNAAEEAARAIEEAFHRWEEELGESQ